ncbi:MAG: DNA polymerase III subunit delta [Candidatus Binatia bacterium]
MKQDLRAVLSEIHKRDGPLFLLLHGDDFTLATATKAILDRLLLPENRSFNLERFDGRTNPWDQIETALMTPPLFPGRKVILVENAPYFLSREHKGELGEKVLQLLGEGENNKAARAFLDLLLLEGWTQERWDKLQGSFSAAGFAQLFGRAKKEARKEVEGLLAFCRNSGMNLKHATAGGENRLAEFIEQDLPPWANFVILASHVDRRTRLYRRLEEKGAVLDLSLRREKSGRISRDALLAFLDRHLKEAGKKIESQAREMIWLRAGGELWAVHQELEKLLLYVGESPWIRVRDVEEAFSDQGEAWVFDLTSAITERNPLRALGHLERLLSHGNHPLRLLGPIASETRRLLGARQLMNGEMRGKWDKAMTYPQFQANVLQQGPPLLTRSPYGDYMAFQKAENFTLQELTFHLQCIYQADIRLKSTGNPPGMVMERLILEMCQGQR